ncbi:MAG TPA: hypothetical protein VIL28_13220, partial [Steroidobacteraceae bacterium]
MSARSPMVWRAVVAAFCVLGVAAAGAADRKKPTGTIKDLEGREIQVTRDPPTNVKPQQAIDQYRRFLELDSTNEQM